MPVLVNLKIVGTFGMANSERDIGELLVHAKELKETADRLIEQSKRLMDEYDRLWDKPKRNEDFSQAATRIVKEAMERN